jgi:16S rRNA (adenine1518-N6/adenine1519-N6)-dimethyltransferase
MKKTRRKALGQHFLTHRKTLLRIVAVIAPRAGEIIVEIGAGKGALTRYLALSGADIIALEKDKALIPHLKKLDYSNLVVLEKDVLRTRFRDLVHGKTGKIVGNLPYAISSPILFKVLEEKDTISSCVFLLQKEVAQRVCASPGTKKYAPISILLQNDFVPHLHFSVPATAFSPPPQVQSGLISLAKRPQAISLVPHQEAFARFLRASFQSRRKMLSNNLKALAIPSSLIEETYRVCGIDEKWRPEQVSLQQYVALYTYLFRNEKKAF